MTAGTRSTQTTVASSATMTARARPISLTMSKSPDTKPRKTIIMMRAAEVTTSDRCSPFDRSIVVVSNPLLDSGQDEDLVVHRQAGPRRPLPITLRLTPPIGVKPSSSTTAVLNTHTRTPSDAANDRVDQQRLERHVSIGDGHEEYDASYRN